MLGNNWILVENVIQPVCTILQINVFAGQLNAVKKSNNAGTCRKVNKVCDSVLTSFLV